MEFKKTAYIFLFFLLVCFIVYGNSLNNGFIVDDYELILHNSSIKNIKYIFRLFTESYLGSYYRPLTNSSFSFDYLIWKLNPFGHHLTNVLLHGCVSFLFFSFLYVLFDSFKLSVLSSLLFAIHPINNVSVNYISDRGNLLVALFMLGALISFCLGYKKRRFGLYGTGFLLFIFSLFSRENALLFPLYFLCMITVLPQDNKKRDYNHAVLGAQIFIIAFYLILRYYLKLPIFSVQKVDGFLSIKSIGTFVYVIMRYFSQALYPGDIVFFRKIVPLDNIGAIILLILCIPVFFFALFYFYRKSKIFFFALSWFLIGVMPLYRLLFARPSIGLMMQTSWIYFSSMGLFLIFSIVLTWLVKKTKKKAGIIFLSIILIFYSSKTILINPVYIDTQTYCRYWLKVFPDNPIADWMLAMYYFAKNDYEKAIFYSKKTIAENQEVDTTTRSGRVNQLGIIYSRLGEFNKALVYSRQALKINPRNTLAMHNIGNVFFKKDQLDKALFFYNKAIENGLEHEVVYDNLAMLFQKLGNSEKASEFKKKVLNINPDYYRQSSLKHIY